MAARTEPPFTTHLRRGNVGSSWAAAGGFEPLRVVPAGKQVVLGPVTTKRPELESKDEQRAMLELIVETAAEVWG